MIAISTAESGKTGQVFTLLVETDERGCSHKVREHVFKVEEWALVNIIQGRVYLL
jgi:hypothetical protein